MRVARDRVRQQPALVEPDVPRRRADQPRDRVLLHVLAHVETQKLEAERFAELLGDLGLAHAGRAGEQERPHRFLRLAQPRTRQPNGAHQRFDGRILAEHDALEVCVQTLQAFLVGRGHAARRNARDLGDDGLDIGVVDDLLAVLLGRGADLERRAHLVDHVDGLVGQEPVVDVLGGQFGRGLECVGRIFHAVVFFVVRLESLEDFDRVFDARLVHFDFLKAARQRAVAFEVTPVFLIRGGTDAAQLARLQGRLEDVRGVHGPAAGRARAHDGVDFVDEQNRPRLGVERLEDGLEALFELAAELRTRQHRPHVQRIDFRVREHVGHVAVGDLEGEAVGDRRLADARIAHVDRVVLAAPAQHVNRALDLHLAPDQRVGLAVAGFLHQVGRERFQRILGRPRVAVVVRAVGAGRRFLAPGDLGDAVRNVVQHVQPGHAVLFQQIDGVVVVLAEQGHEEIPRLDHLFAARLHVGRGALQHAVEGERLLWVDVARIFGQGFEIVLEELFQVGLEFLHVRAALPHDVGHGLVLQQGVQDVFQGQELVAPPARFGDRQGDRDLQFPTDPHGGHSSKAARLPRRCTSGGIRISWRGRPRARLSPRPPRRGTPRRRPCPGGGCGA